MGYSRRIYVIVGKLLEQSSFTSWERVAHDLDIAKRTIFREMKDIEKLVIGLGMTLHKKTKIGVYLEANGEQRRQFQMMLEACSDKTLTQEGRLKYITSQLLKSAEPQKLFYYASKLGVSEATISHDMDKLETWFGPRGIQLIRKPGLGVYLEGSELTIRRALVDHLYENEAFQDQAQALVNLISYSLEDLPVGDGLLDQHIFVRVGRVLHEFEAALIQRLTGNAYTSLAIHLTIAVQRILRGDRIAMTGEVLHLLQQDIQFEIARAIGDRVSEVFNIAFPEDELGYITMHLKGAKLKTSGIIPISDMVLSNFDMTRLASKMVKGFTQQSGISLQGDEELLVGLVSHLKPAVTRLKLALAIRNPLLEQIKDLYPEIYSLTAKVASVIEQEYKVVLPDSEVGYLAMHFGAAIERQRRREKKDRPVSIALVCASGIGTSSLLASRIAQQFEHVVFAGQFSKQDIESRRTFTDIDLIITTVGLDPCEVPVILVNPLLAKADLKEIEKYLEQIKFKHLQGPAIPIKHGVVSQPSVKNQTMERARRLHSMSSAVLQVAEHFTMQTLEVGTNIFEAAAQSMTPLACSVQDLADLFANREKLGSTLLKGEGIMLLHTQVPNQEVPLFAVRNLARPYLHPSAERVDHLVVMVMNRQTDSNMGSPCPPEVTALLSWISQGLIEDEAFLRAIKSEDYELCFEELSLRMNTWLEKAKAEVLL